MEVTVACRLARAHLAESLPQRWQHVQAVAAEADRIADGLVLDRDALMCAAWLHDIGYAPTIATCGFHPLDGARFLRSRGWPADVCNLVAHHSCARVEANERGFARQLCDEFDDTATAERDALWAADATTGPDGRRISLSERVREVEQRYGPDHLVAQCIRAIRPELEAAITRTRARAAVSTQPR